MLQKLFSQALTLNLLRKVKPVTTTITRLSSSDSNQLQIHVRTNSPIIRHSLCPCCVNLLQKRFIHHPETFKDVIKKPFEWGYGTHNGPYSWFLDHPIAINGHRQSPVHILTRDVAKSEILRAIPLRWKYCPDKMIDIENTGRSWTVNVEGSETGLIGGPLVNEYELWQFHAHWGNTDDHGSEHTIDGKSYPAELHLVHWNSSKYHSPMEAVSKSDGLAVLGIFLELSDEPHEEFAKITDLMKDIRYRNERAKITQPVDVTKFLPKSKQDREYWTYDGSLTTPPLMESVTWILFHRTMKISHDQLDTMRSLLFSSREEWEQGKAEYMINNFRPAVPIGNRIIRQG